MAGKEGAKPRLLRYLKEHAGESIPYDALKAVAGDVGDWTRTLRSLRDDGYILDYDSSERCYYFPYVEPQNEPKDNRHINNKLRAMVLLRDNSTCRMCGRSVSEDGIRVHIDHIIPHSWGGKTELENLQVLCSECNEGKKNFVKGEDPELMKSVSRAKSAKERLRLYFEHYRDTPLGIDRLSVIAKSREWTRALRYLREDYGMDIEYVPKSKRKGTDKEYYIYHTK